MTYLNVHNVIAISRDITSSVKGAWLTTFILVNHPLHQAQIVVLVFGVKFTKPQLRRKVRTIDEVLEMATDSLQKQMIINCNFLLCAKLRSHVAQRQYSL